MYNTPDMCLVCVVSLVVFAGTQVYDLFSTMYVHRFHENGTYAGLRVPGDQRHITSALPAHLVDVLTVVDGPQSFADSSGSLSSIFFLLFPLNFMNI